MQLYDQVSELHKKYGASIPKESFTPEVYEMLATFKESGKDMWLDDTYIFALANMDRYVQQYAAGT